MARPEGLEPPTLCLEGRFRNTRRTTPASKSQQNQRDNAIRVGPFRLLLYPVHGQLHGQFRLPLQPFVLTAIKPSGAMTFALACKPSASAAPKRFRGHLHRVATKNAP